MFVNKAIVNANLFNGDSLLEEHAVIINGKNIVDVIPQSQLPADIHIAKDLKGNSLIPGFVDLQVNGGGGFIALGQ